MLGRIFSLRIDKQIDNKITDLSIRLRKTKGEIVRYAIEQLYQSVHNGGHISARATRQQNPSASGRRNEQHERPYPHRDQEVD